MGIGDVLFGSSGAKEAAAERTRLQEEANRKSEQALDMYNYVNLPLQEKLNLAYENPQLVGLLTPEEISGTALENVQIDPKLREAQMSALQSLQNTANEGISAEEQYQMQLLRNKGTANVNANQAAVMQDLAQRGLAGGAGSSARTEALLKAQASQSQGNTDQLAALQLGAANEEAKRQAIQQAAGLAGNIESSDYQRAANKASAQDAITRFNAQNRQDVAAKNLTAQQQVADAKTELANRAQAQNAQYNIGLNQQQFQNQLGLTGAKAGVLTGQANMLNQQASQVQARPSGGLFAPLATIGGAALGGALSGKPGSGFNWQGAGAGASIGSGVGGGVTNYAQSQYEDGGIVGTKTEGNLKEVYGKKLQSAVQDSDLSKLLKMIKFAEGGVVEKDLGKYVDNTTNREYNVDGSDNTVKQLKNDNVYRYADGGLTMPQMQMPQSKAMDLGAYNLSDPTAQNTDQALKDAEMAKAMSLQLQKPDMLNQPEQSSSMSPEALEALRSIVGTATSDMERKAMPQRSPASVPVSFGAPKLDLEVARPKLYAPKVGQFAEGGIIESKVGQFRDQSKEQVEYTPNAFVQNPTSIYGSGMSKSETEYFKSSALEDLCAISPKDSAMYADGGTVKKFEDNGKGKVVPGHSYVGDRIDARINSGEMVLNLEQQQRLMELLKGKKDLKEMPKEDVVRDASNKETNLHDRTSKLEARLAAIEKVLKK